MYAKEERYCTLRHARNASAQAKLLKNSPKHGYAQRFHAAFLMQVASSRLQVQVRSGQGQVKVRSSCKFRSAL